MMTLRPISRCTALLLLLALIAFPSAAQPAAQADDGVVDVTIRGMVFLAPSEVPSGWTTFRLHNASELAHFALIDRMPEGKGIEDHRAEVGPVFQRGADLLYEGETEAAMEEFGRLPTWYSEIMFSGGPGLLSAGEATSATVHLEPGTYLLECYVKTDGAFHPMVHEFTVTEEPGGGAPPEPTVEVTVSSERGIEVAGAPAAGEHVVAVRFADQTTHEHFLGHDVHLARFDGPPDEADLAALEAWMDWSTEEGLETPEPVTFIGGMQDLPAGRTGYFTATLAPGHYAWVSEVPGAVGKGMLRPFEVTAGRGADR